jgi:hypothetical protein
MLRKLVVGVNILCVLVIGGTIAAFFAVDSSRPKFQELRSVSLDNQLVYKEAKSMQHTLSIAQGASPAENSELEVNENSASSLFPSVIDDTNDNTIMNAANVPLGDIGFSAAEEKDPGKLAIETAEEQLSKARRWKRAKYEEIALKETALKEQRKAQKQLLRAAQIALKETALKEQRKAQKQLRREAHIQHLERERRRRREATAEFERAKRWAQKQKEKKRGKAQRNPKTEFQWAKQHAVISRHSEAPAQLAEKQAHATRHKDLKVTLANLVPAVEMSAGLGGHQKVAAANPNVPRAASVYSEDESLEEPVRSRSIAHKQQASSIFSAIWHTLTGE